MRPLKRQEANQNLGFASRPFVLCGLPIKKPAPASCSTRDATASSRFR